MSTSLLHYLDKYIFSLVEKSRDVFWIKSADYAIQIYINPAYEEVWGRSREDLIADPDSWLNFVHAEDRDKVDAAIQLRRSGAAPLTASRLIYRIIRPDYSIRWVSDDCFPLHDEQGNHIGFAGIARDITQEKMIEEELQYELKVSSQYLPRLAERMEKNVFWVRDPSLSKQLYLSPAFEKIWGISIKEFYQNPNVWNQTLIDEDRPKRTIESMLRNLEEQGAATYYDDVYRIKRPDGAIRWIHDTSFPIYHENVCIGFAGIAEDITREKEYEAQLKSAKAQAESANQAKSEFLANITHDLKSPLSSMMSMAQLIKRKRIDPKLDPYIDHMLNACQSLNNLIDGILNFSKLEAGRYEFTADLLNLFDMLGDVVALLTQQALQKNVKLIVSINPDVPNYIIGDGNALRRVLINLLANAVKFTQKGHILLKVKPVTLGTDRNTLEFVIEDTGVGIPSDRLDYIFERFHRLIPESDGHIGTGLGLSIVKQFVTTMGGEIQVNSEIGKGTTFRIKLPFAIAPLAVRTPKWQRHYHNTRILIADDYLLRGQTLAEHLGQTLCHIVPGEEVKTKLQQAREKSSPYQILIVDDEIPMGALHLAKDLRTDPRLKDLLLLLLAKPGTLLEHDAAKSAGYFDFIVKPIIPHEFTSFLAKCYSQWLSLLNNQKEQIRAYTPSVLLVEATQEIQHLLASMLQEIGCKVHYAGTAATALDRYHRNLDLIMLNLHLPDLEGDSVVNLIRQNEDKANPIPIIGITTKLLEEDALEKFSAAGVNDIIQWPVPQNKLFDVLVRWTLSEIA